MYSCRSKSDLDFSFIGFRVVSALFSFVPESQLYPSPKPYETAAAVPNTAAVPYPVRPPTPVGSVAVPKRAAPVAPTDKAPLLRIAQSPMVVLLASSLASLEYELKFCPA
jgi:hypothetical protein